MLISCVACQDGERVAEIEPLKIHSYIGRPNYVFHRLRKSGCM